MDIQLTARGAGAPAFEDLRYIDDRAAWIGWPPVAERESRARLRTDAVRRRGDPEDGTPWWVAAILVAIFGVAMFLSGLIVGHHLAG